MSKLPLWNRRSHLTRVPRHRQLGPSRDAGSTPTTRGPGRCRRRHSMIWVWLVSSMRPVRPRRGIKRQGVQQQYLGCVGKVDNGIVTVHIGVSAGPFQMLLDAELYLPASWAADRKRCREAGIPDDVRYRSKWRIALDQLLRLTANGVSLDWLTFDEEYGLKTPFLWVLGLVNQKFVAEVPTNFSMRTRPYGPSVRADRHQPGTRTGRWKRYRIKRKTLARRFRRQRGVDDLRHTGRVIRYHQHRNEQATRSHKNYRPKCVI